jgi:membrane protein implicated in regulation of membrane protease activity
VGLLTLAVAPGLPIELGLFAVLTIASTYFARRFLRPVLDAGNPDLNDPSLRLVGRDGEALAGFENGKGRVFVDGKEWAAVIQDGEPPAAGQKVLVVAVDGAVLTVR